jgi:hypothetical protein
VAQLSHKFIILLLLGLILLPIFSVSSVAYITEPGSYWKVVQRVGLNSNVSGPHYVIAETFENYIEVDGPEWLEVDEINLMMTNTTSGAGGWVVASTINVKADTRTTWTFADGMIIRFDTETTWVQTDFVSNDVDTETQFINVSSTFNDLRSDEVIIPVVPEINDDEVSWLIFILYLVILWLPGMLLGILAPFWGQIIGSSIMGILMFMMYPSFLMVLFMIIICFGVMIYKGVNS